MRDRFTSALVGAGHAAVAVKTAAELLTRIRGGGERFDLIVLDLRLPNAGGVALVRAIRSLDGGRMPILVFSGTVAAADEVRELATLGVAGYINEYSAVQNILPALAPHLFPDNFNRRGSPRVTLGIPASYRVGNTIAAALTLNLSKGGIAIRTMSPPEPGAKLKIRFTLPDSPAEVEAESRIAWIDRRVGMGLQFEKVAAASQAAIDQFVDQHFFKSKGLTAFGVSKSKGLTASGVSQSTGLTAFGVSDPRGLVVVAAIRRPDRLAGRRALTATCTRRGGGSRGRRCPARPARAPIAPLYCGTSLSSAL